MDKLLPIRLIMINAVLIRLNGIRKWDFMIWDMISMESTNTFISM